MIFSRLSYSKHVGAHVNFDFITRGDDHLYKRTLYGKIMEIKVENRELSDGRRLIRLE